MSRILKHSYSVETVLICLMFAGTIQAATEFYDFDSDTVGDVPAGWSVVGKPAGDIRVRSDQSISAPNALRAQDNNNAFMTWLGRELPSPQLPPFTLDCSIYNKGAGATTFAISKDSYVGPAAMDNAIFLFAIEDGWLRYYGTDYAQLTPLSNDEWHKITVQVGSLAKEDVYIEGVLAGTVTAMHPAERISQIHLGSPGTNTNVGDG